MNKHSSLRTSGSLLERASQVYDFASEIKVPGLPEALADPAIEERPRRAPKKQALPPAAEAEAPMELTERAPEPAAKADQPRRPVRKQRPLPPPGPVGKVDREGLRDAGFIMPDAPVTGLAEEFRIVKRQLLIGASGSTGVPDDKRQTILVCSAQPDEGKTFCAINLALSIATEKDLEVLLVDGDFAKPEILSILGLEGGPGLIDAIVDPSIDPESLVIRTDIEGLSVLPAGSQANNVTELLASERTRGVLEDLTSRHPKRIVVFDSPPALMASPASVLASKVGQVMVVVRADQTSEADLREAVALLAGCDNLSLMLNATGFAATGRRFGSYYGYGQ